MNAYRFYYKGEYYTTCYTNDVAEDHIYGCADLGKRGLTPYFWHDPDTNKDVLIYTDSFKLEKVFRDYTGNYTSRVITPENIGILAKSIQKQLSKFHYNGEEWEVKKC